MQFIIDHSMDVESMLGIGFRTEYLIKRIGRQVDDPFLGCQDLHPLGKRRTHPYHIRRDIKHNRRLLPVRSAAIHLCTLLPVPTGQQQGHCRCQFGFSLLFGDLNICLVELPVSILFDRPKQIPDNLLLPVNQFKLFPCPFSFRMAQALNKRHRVVRSLFVIMGTLRHEPGLLILLQFSHDDSLLIFRLAYSPYNLLAAQSLAAAAASAEIKRPR